MRFHLYDVLEWAEKSAKAMQTVVNAARELIFIFEDKK